MKIVVVGESIVTGDKLAKAAESLVFRNSVVVKRIEWHTGERAEFQRKTLNIEKNGPESESYPPQLPDEIRDADVLLIHFCPIPREVISKAKNLKLIGICRGGTENIDVEAAAERDIPVIHVIRNAEPVAEFTVGMILSETRNLARSYLAIKNGIWRKDFSNSGTLSTIKGKRIGIIGLGHIGKLVAKKLSGFDVALYGYDPFVSEEALKRVGLNIKMVSLEELFRESDVVTIHVRLTPDTQNMVNQKLVSLMKPSAYLINTARAGLMDEEAFRDAILNKRIAGAALDVFWKEPIPADDALVQADNVTLTSHIAGLTVDAIPNSPSMLAEAINDYLKNGTRDLIVNAKSVSSESIEELRTM